MKKVGCGILRRARSIIGPAISNLSLKVIWSLLLAVHLFFLRVLITSLSAQIIFCRGVIKWQKYGWSAGFSHLELPIAFAFQRHYRETKYYVWLEPELFSMSRNAWIQKIWDSNIYYSFAIYEPYNIKYIQRAQNITQRFPFTFQIFVFDHIQSEISPISLMWTLVFSVCK